MVDRNFIMSLNEMITFILQLDYRVFLTWLDFRNFDVLFDRISNQVGYDSHPRLESSLHFLKSNSRSK